MNIRFLFAETLRVPRELAPLSCHFYSLSLPKRYCAAHTTSETRLRSDTVSSKKIAQPALRKPLEES